MEVSDVNEQFLDEFLEALQSAINQMSADGTRISFVTSKGRELGKYMSDILDEEWRQNRGVEIASVGIASISYDEESTKLINMRNQGAMLSDPTIREGYVQGAVARGMEAAGSNAAGSVSGFMGMGMGMQAGSGVMSAASEANIRQMEMNRQNAQASAAARPALIPGSVPVERKIPENSVRSAENRCRQHGSVPVAQKNTGKFCTECGKPAPAAPWTCSCGAVNTGKFCAECGKPKA